MKIKIKTRLKKPTKKKGRRTVRRRRCGGEFRVANQVSAKTRQSAPISRSLSVGRRQADPKYERGWSATSASLLTSRSSCLASPSSSHLVTFRARRSLLDFPCFNREDLSAFCVLLSFLVSPRTLFFLKKQENLK